MITSLDEARYAEHVYQLELRAQLRRAGRDDPDADAILLDREAKELAPTTAASLKDVRRLQRAAIDYGAETRLIDAYVRWQLNVPARTTQPK